MKKILFIQYPKCSTCKKAAKWLENNNIKVETQNIVENNPNEKEIEEWVNRSGLPINKFFNTSGKSYKELKLKDKIKTALKTELVSLLASDGMLIKRPVIVSDDFVLVGFNEEEWAKYLKK